MEKRADMQDQAVPLWLLFGYEQMIKQQACEPRRFAETLPADQQTDAKNQIQMPKNQTMTSLQFSQLWADIWQQGWQAPRRRGCRWWWRGRRWWRCWRRTSAPSPPVCSQRSEAGCATQSWWGEQQGQTGWKRATILNLYRIRLLSFSPFSCSRCFATGHCQHVVRKCPLASRWRNVHVT